MLTAKAQTHTSPSKTAWYNYERIELISPVYLIPALPKLHGIITEEPICPGMYPHTSPSKTAWYNYVAERYASDKALIPALPKLHGIITQQV